MGLELSGWRQIVADWNGCHGAFYRVRESDIYWNLVGQSWLTYKIAELNGVRALYAVASEQGQQAGIPAKSLWLSIWSEVPSGAEKDFLLACEKLAKEEAKERLVFCGEEFHLFPGVAVDEDSGLRLCQQAIDLGFQYAEASDFSGSLHAPEVAQYIAEGEARATSEGWRLEAAQSAVEYEALAQFLGNEFPGRWSREFQYWLKAMDSQRGIWLSLRDGGGQLLGFARLAVRWRYSPLEHGWTPGALRLPLRENAGTLGEATDGCLGPIGVASTERGRGAGKILLALVLKKLKENNASQICIDWTNAYKYYMPLHFRELRRFRSLWKKW